MITTLKTIAVALGVSLAVGLATFGFTLQAQNADDARSCVFTEIDGKPMMYGGACDEFAPTLGIVAIESPANN